MRTWLTHDRLLDAGRNLRVRFADTTRRVRIREGDRVVIATAGGRDAQFTGEAIVDEITALPRSRDAAALGEPSADWHIHMGRHEPFDAPRLLSDLRFSLLFVKSPRIPSRSLPPAFGIPYRSLDDVDYTTIRENRILWSRTAVGEALAALPDSALQDFHRAVATTTPALLESPVDFGDLWRRLLEFIRTQYLAQGLLLIRSGRMLRALAGKVRGGDDLPSIGLEHLMSDGTASAIDGVLDQASAFQALFDLAGPRDGAGVLGELEERVHAQTAVQELALKKLGRRGWPVERSKLYGLTRTS